MGAIHESAKRWRERVEFLVVYICEAHPIDGWQIDSNIEDGVEHASPTTDAEALTLLRRLAFVITGLPPSPADPDKSAFRSSSGSGAGPASSSYDRSVSKPFGTSAKVPAFPSVRSLEVRGCGFGEECEEALEAAVRANRARLEARAVAFPDRVSGIVTISRKVRRLR